jgi:hypothetical protein
MGVQNDRTGPKTMSRGRPHVDSLSKRKKRKSVETGLIILTPLFEPFLPAYIYSNILDCFTAIHYRERSIPNDLTFNNCSTEHGAGAMGLVIEGKIR